MTSFKPDFLFYDPHGDKAHDSLISHLFLHMMEVMEGNPRTKLGKKAMHLFMMVGTAFSQAAHYYLANLFGLHVCNFLKHCW